MIAAGVKVGALDEEGEGQEKRKKVVYDSRKRGARKNESKVSPAAAGCFTIYWPSLFRTTRY